MTEAEWLGEYIQVEKLIDFTLAPRRLQQSKVGKRKLRLFTCGSFRVVWDGSYDERVSEAVEIAEQFADREVGQLELEAARARLIDSFLQMAHSAKRADFGTVGMNAWATACTIKSDSEAIRHIRASARYDLGAKQRKLLLCKVFHCVFGNPFRPVTVHPSWLTSTVLAVAEGIYTDRAFGRMPILADALQDAGCDNEEIVQHCRQPGEHVRGCWVVDLLTNRK